MNRYTILALILLGGFSQAQTKTPAQYWLGLSLEEKMAFINGSYSTAVILKHHHRQEVKKQYQQDPNWVEPYYIQRFYEIVDEYRSREVDYDITIIAGALDALYSNYDNTRIPLLEALRVVSLDQDGKRGKANLYLLRAQKKYQP